MRAGVDTGGTFTDFVWWDGRLLHIHKELSTPTDPSRAILAGIERMGVGENAGIVHGSTVATNAILERRGAPTALVTTAGFADILSIGRQNRPDLYALVPQKPEPLVPQRWRFTVAERVTAAGDILRALDPAALETLLAQLAAEPIESVAVCLLFAFLRPDHERAIAQAIADRLPHIANVSLSSDILPEYREYERTSTTVINAYVAPLMRRYLQRLAAGVAPRPLTVMQSNGGVIQAETAGKQAARTVLSGPAGGVVGARFVAAQVGLQEIITFDMGGTSTDVALCPARLPTTTHGEIAGMPLRLPIIDIHTVGAGGGSLAYVDAGGALHVGPQSAGADPGPACYGRQAGQAPPQATTTDANLVLGRLDAAHFLGGTMRLREDVARQALRRLATAMRAPTAQAAAWGVLQVANATMERAIRRISVERGYDPRHFTLVAFGGAGPLHACDLAHSLGIPRVLVPAFPGVLSALGMLVAPPTRDYSQTIMLKLQADDPPTLLTAAYDDLSRRALADMSAAGHSPDHLTRQCRLDMRYVGQSHELSVPAPADLSDPSSLMMAFHQAHQQRYGYHQPEAAVEIVTIRLAAIADIPLPTWHTPANEREHQEARMGRKQVWFHPNGPTPTPLLDRARLRSGDTFTGPAILVQYDTTTVVPPDWLGQVVQHGHLLLQKIDENTD
ncbi:MAG: hydantoinase/oxoprolinase family protein [Anaerolineales bacterium]|nr:hydantoinase/oxoprolinase family protein [Anaerolineales bacterium]